MNDRPPPLILASTSVYRRGLLERLGRAQGPGPRGVRRRCGGLGALEVGGNPGDVPGQVAHPLVQLRQGDTHCSDTVTHGESLS